MSITTVNKLSDGARSAIYKLIHNDDQHWLSLERYNGKIGMYDDSGAGIHFTLQAGLLDMLSYLDYDIEHEDYELTADEIQEFRDLCKVLHIYLA